MTDLKAIARDYYEQMSDEARAYLNGRGITDRTITKFGLGYVASPALGHEDYAGRISIPYMTKLGGVVGFKFRRVGDEKAPGNPKYLSNHMPTRLYNTLAFEQADELGYIAIMEGESDTWTLGGEVGIPAVGIPGSDTWAQHDEWPLLFEGYDTVLLFTDDDDAGKKLRRKVEADLKNARHVPLATDCNDVNDWLRVADAEEIRRAAGV